MPSITPDHIKAALRITPLFYDAVLEPTRWREALKAICEFFAPAVAATVHFNSLGLMSEGGTREPHYLMYSYGLSEEAVQAYLTYGRYGPDVDPRVGAYTRYINRPVPNRDLVSAEEWHKSPTYKDLFEPHGLDHDICISIQHEGLDTHLSIGVYRGPEGPAFSQVDVEKFQLLVPHLRRAAEVYARLVGSELKSRQLENAFEDLALATIFTDTSGRILFANHAANQLLDAGDGLFQGGGQLAHRDPGIASQLKRYIREISASTQFGGGGRVTHLTLPRAEQTPLLATVCSLASSSPESPPYLSSQLRVAIFLTDPQKSYETTTEHLQRIFGLTQTEAEIAKDLTAGLTLKEIAGKRGRALETVRQQLKSVMSKTGARRQAELVKSVLALGVPLEQ